MQVIYHFLNQLLPFEWAQFDFMKNALLAVLIITPLFGLTGTMIVNNRMSFFSDALGHSALTGIAIGVLLGIDNYMFSMIGFALLFALAISAVIESGTTSADTVIGVFSSAGMALGIVLLSANGGFSKYSSYLIGDILIVTPSEILYMALVLTASYIIWFIIYNRLLIVSINSSLASSRGINCALMENIFVVMLAVSVMLSVKWIGILTINSLLILPPAAARNIALNSKQYHFISLFIGVISGMTGLILSFYTGTSAGATMVLSSAVIYFITLLFKKSVRK